MFLGLRTPSPKQPKATSSFWPSRGPRSLTALAGLPDWDGRILINTTDVFTYADGQPAIADLCEQIGSEITAAHAPRARVIKAFNTLYAGRQIVFYAWPNRHLTTLVTQR